MSPRSNLQGALHLYAVLTTIATFVLLIAGSLVTSTDSGLAVPDWPLSYGTWFPPMVGGIRFEHGHRMIAAAVGLMILILAAWLWKTERRRWVRMLGYSALGGVMIQGLLGGLTVLWMLPPQVSIAHACLGQTVFCLVVSLAWCTSARTATNERQQSAIIPPAVLTGSLVIVGMAFLQLLLGAIIRHTGYAVSPHIAGAVLLVLSTGWLVARTRSLRETEPVLSANARRLLGLLCVQVILGLVVLGHRGAVTSRTAHVALGALVLAQAVVVVWEAARSCHVSTSRVGPRIAVGVHG